MDEAIEILARIQAGGDVNDPLVVAEWEEITTILAAERGKRSTELLSITSVRTSLSFCLEHAFLGVARLNALMNEMLTLDFL